MTVAADPDTVPTSSIQLVDSQMVNSSQERDRRTGWLQKLAESIGRIIWPDFLREVGRQSWLLGRWVLLAFLLEALIMGAFTNLLFGPG
jgi:hypothetical protein